VVDVRLGPRLVGSIVRNSRHHGPAARRGIEVAENAPSVGDDGPGMPLTQQANALQAFQRGASSTGHGLGLAIVAQIIALHGGEVMFSPPPGLTVCVYFTIDQRHPSTN